MFFCEHVIERHDEEFYTSEEVLNSDVFIPLEIIDWTLSSYIRDAAYLGHGKAILEIGHFNVEEAGMEHMAKQWLPEVLNHTVPVTFIQSGDCFEYVINM